LSRASGDEEVIKLLLLEGAIRDANGWTASSLDNDFVIAFGNVLEPGILSGTSTAPTSETIARLPFYVAGGAAGLVLLVGLAIYCRFKCAFCTVVCLSVCLSRPYLLVDR